MKKIHYSLIIPEEHKGLRLDQAVLQQLPQHSRTEIQKWMKQGCITINEMIIKTRAVLKGGEIVCIDAIEKQEQKWLPEALPLEIIHEDESLLVINKAAGLVVHPAAGHTHQTLLNALLHHLPALYTLPRAGIVHRLDKDTSGLLVVAKSMSTYHYLTKQLKKRSILREYQTIVDGLFISGGSISQPIGRHPIHRKQMAVQEEGRPAITHYRIIEKYKAHTRLAIRLETGRTHQIRVHMAYIRHPIVGDPVYHGRLSLPKGATPSLIAALRGFKRQALHAYRLGLTHPITHKWIQWESKLPEDMNQLIHALKQKE